MEGTTRRDFLKRTLAVGVGMGLASAVSACAPAATPVPAETPEPAEAEPILMGVTFGLTGPGAFVANAGKDGCTFAAEEINAKGGVLGRRIELRVQDSKQQATEAVSVLRRFVSQDNIRFIVGPQSSGEVLAAIPVVKELEAVTITTMSTNPGITEQQGKGGNPWMFRVNPPDDGIARALVRIAVEQLGDTHVAIVARNDDFGRGAAEQIATGVVDLGGEVTSSNFFQVGGAYDFSSTLTKLKTEPLQAVAFVGTIEEGIPFIRQLHEQGLEARIYSRGISLTSSLYEQLGSELVDGLHGVEPYFAEIDTPENAAFVQRWRARFGVEPINQGYFSYVATHMMAEAISKAGSDDPEKVREALTGVIYPGVTGEIKFDEYNQAHADVYVGRVDCEGDVCGVTVVASAPSV